MLAPAGHLNRKDSPGIRHGKTLMLRPKPEAVRQQTDDDKVGLGSFGMKASVLEHFRRIAEPDVQSRLALQRQQMLRARDAESRAAAKQKQRWFRSDVSTNVAQEFDESPAYHVRKRLASWMQAHPSDCCPRARGAQRCKTNCF